MTDQKQRALNAQANARLWADVAWADRELGWTQEALHAQSMAYLWADIAADLRDAAEWTL